MDVQEFAKQEGYDKAIYKEKWNGYDVYDLVYTDNKVHYVGLPYKALVKGMEIRFSTPQETLVLMSE